MFEYITHILVQICFLTIIGQSLSLLVGVCRQVSLAHASFYAIGAYSAALLSVGYGLPFGTVLLTAISLAVAASAVLAYLSRRSVDDYYIIVTLGFHFLVISFIANSEEITNGANGIAGIPSLNIAGFVFDSRSHYLFLCIFLAGIVWFVLERLYKSPLGKRLLVVGQDEVWAQSIGINVRLHKSVVHMLAGTIVAIVGIIMAHYTRYVDPTIFSLDAAILFLSCVIIGGMYRLPLIFAAAVFLTVLPEFLRYVGLPPGLAGDVRRIVYGLAIVGIVMSHAVLRQRKLHAASE